MNEIQINKIIQNIKAKNILLVDKLNIDFKNSYDVINALHQLIYDIPCPFNFELKDFNLYHNRKEGNYSYEYIDKINLESLKNYENNDVFEFFGKIYSNNKQEFDKFKYQIYINDNKFYNKIDFYLIQYLLELGYKKVNKDKYIKCISDNFQIILNFNFKDRMKYGFKQPYDYNIPNFQFSIFNTSNSYRNLLNKEYGSYFSKVFPFLFSSLFHYFFIDHNYEMLLKLHNEPKITYNEESKIYELSNCLENIKRFNKFIYLYIELYKHYFEIFEKWLIDDVNPVILEMSSNPDGTDIDNG